MMAAHAQALARRRNAAISRLRAAFDTLFVDLDGRFLTVEDRDDVLLVRTTGPLRVDPLIARSLGQHLIKWADTQPPLK
ncbi:MAG: hypothetical protein ABI131_00565 [Nostocoides sp.]